MIDVLQKELDSNYYANLKVWDRRSSIRSRPRRILEESEKNQLFFPIARQPLVIHPLVQKLGKDVAHYILIQTVYKFMFDIAILETEVVNTGALMVANDQLSMGFPPGLRHDALSIIIDEAYHAYVAIDYMDQVTQVTGIKPIEIPKRTAVIDALKFIKVNLDQRLIPLFELIAVCIGEHVLTKDLISIGKDKEVGQFFQDIMADHVLDEGRHATIFAYILDFLWKRLSDGDRDVLGPLLPIFMREYLRPDIQKAYDEKILISLRMNEDEIDRVMKDTYFNSCTIGLNNNNPVIINLITLLQRCHVLDHEKTKTAFKNYNLL
jgi:hypothetical protein